MSDSDPSGNPQQPTDGSGPGDLHSEDAETHLFGGLVAMLVGFLILLAGFVLWVGEKGNRLFLFPFAGRVTMVVGILVLAGGATLAGRRAALMLSALTVLGGLALYGIGVVFLEQLGTRLYQAGGLLTALVGLIAAFTVFRISQPDS